MQLKVARNGNWVMSTKVLGGEDPRTTRKYRSVSLEKRGFSDRHSAIDDFSFFLRWTNRENAWRGRLGKMWSTLTLEQGSRREDIEPASPEAELPHQVSMETWHSLSGFSSFSSCSSFSSLLWLLSLFLSLSLSPSPFSLPARIGTAGSPRRVRGSASPSKNDISRYFPQTEGKNYLVSRKLILQPRPVSIFKFYFAMAPFLFPLPPILDHLRVSNAASPRCPFNWSFPKWRSDLTPHWL